MQDENCLAQAMRGLHEVVESLGWKFALTGSKIQHLYNETAFYICKDKKETSKKVREHCTDILSVMFIYEDHNIYQYLLKFLKVFHQSSFIQKQGFSF